MAAARDQMALAAGGRRGAEAGPEARSRRLGGSARGGGGGPGQGRCFPPALSCGPWPVVPRLPGALPGALRKEERWNGAGGGRGGMGENLEIAEPRFPREGGLRVGFGSGGGGGGGCFFVLKVKWDLLFIQQPHPSSSLNLKLSGTAKIKNPDPYHFQSIKFIFPLHLQGC